MKYQNVNTDSRILGCKRTFRKCGKAGIEVSDLFPHQGEVVDDLCIVRSMHGDMVVHSAAQYQMMTGRVIPGFPAMGSWVVYGLGSEAESLPAYVVMPTLPVPRKRACRCTSMDFCLPCFSLHSCGQAANTALAEWADVDQLAVE